MSGLADDCFRDARAVMTADAALARVAEQAFPMAGIERVALEDAAGRILAEDARAAIASPPHDNAGVDGYALRRADLGAGDTRLAVTMRIPAGRPAPGPLPAGAAARIFTGAVPPEGADAVVMQEDARAEGDHVTIPAGAMLGMNIRRAGEDIAAGAVALTAGRLVRPGDLALAASVGLDGLSVRQRLRVGVFSTGDELVDPGAPLPPAGVYDANRLALKALLAQKGYAVTDLGRLADRRETVRDALANAARRCDALVTSGGMSEGEEDHVAAAIHDADGDLAFWRLAVKPGRPVAIGRIGDCAVIGLPGNSTAAIVMLMIFGAPLLARLAGAAPRPPLRFPIPAGFAAKKKAGRREYLRVRLVESETGPVALRAGKEGSGILTTLANADGLWEAEESWDAITEGRPGLFRPFPDLAL